MSQYVIRHGRRIEVETLNPEPIKRKVQPFVKVPLWWIAEAAKHTRSPATLVLIELLHTHWKTKSLSFPFPNGRLKKLGVSREIKRRVLEELEQGGLIAVDRPTRKSPIVTLLDRL